LIGLTDDVLKRIEGRSKRGGDKATSVYIDLITAKEYGLSLTEWRQLARWEKKLLRYFRIMESYFTENAHERARREADNERKRQEFMGKLPKQAVRGR